MDRECQGLIAGASPSVNYASGGSAAFRLQKRRSWLKNYRHRSLRRDLDYTFGLSFSQVSFKVMQRLNTR